MAVAVAEVFLLRVGFEEESPCGNITLATIQAATNGDTRCVGLSECDFLLFVAMAFLRFDEDYIRIIHGNHSRTRNYDGKLIGIQ